jgi:hypothetical protein
MAKDVRIEGFDLLSKEINSLAGQNKQQQQNQQQQIQCQQQSGTTNMMEGDAWVINMTHAEDFLLSNSNRNRVYSILKTLRDRHLDFPGTAVTNHLLKVSRKKLIRMETILRFWSFLNAKNITATMIGMIFAWEIE